MKKINRYIGGPGRSNTTILGEIVGKAKNSMLLNEINIVRRLYEIKARIAWKNFLHEPLMINQWCAGMFKENTWWEINDCRRIIWRYNHVDIDPYQLRKQIILLEDSLNKNINEYDGRGHKIVDLYLDLLLSNLPQDKHHIFKQPGIEMELSKISILNDEESSSWKIIFTVKDLLDVATSWFRDQMLPGKDYDDCLDLLEQRIIDGCIAIKRLPPSSVLLVHDRDLYENTENTLKNMFDFLQVEYNPSAMNLYDHNLRRMKEGLKDPVVNHYRKRLESIRESANYILGQELW